jgi:stage II sporulation protein GA (sporulation sigma-E factor processing peptidase)
MILYIDILFLNNTMMSLAILWAVGRLLNLEIKWLKLIYATLFTNLYTFLIIYLKVNNLGGSIFIQLLFNIIAALLMVYIGFDIQNTKRYLQVLGTLYLVTFVTIGASLSFFYIYGVNPFKAGCLVSGIIFLWLIGQYGWRFLQNKINPKELSVKLSIFINDKSITVDGLVDTGNNLYDPMSQFPVIIVELNQFKVFFSESLKKNIKESKGGIIEQVSLLNDHNWGQRIRVMPYSVIGRDDGMLLGIRPDNIRVIYTGKSINVEKIIVGITDDFLDHEGKYQALVNPEILKNRGE